MKEKENEEKIDLVPVAEEPPPLIRLSEGDAKRLINEITEICNMAQSAFNLPPSSSFNRSANFYLNEILKTEKEYSIITD